MAIGAMTVVQLSAARGPVFLDTVRFAGDSAYTTGGTAAFQAKVRAGLLSARGNTTISAVIPQDCGGYVVAYDAVNDKLKVYYGDNNNASDSVLTEVPATTDLSAVTFQLAVITT